MAGKGGPGGYLWLEWQSALTSLGFNNLNASRQSSDCTKGLKGARSWPTGLQCSEFGVQEIAVKSSWVPTYSTLLYFSPDYTHFLNLTPLWYFTSVGHSTSFFTSKSFMFSSSSIFNTFKFTSLSNTKLYLSPLMESYASLASFTTLLHFPFTFVSFTAHFNAQLHFHCTFCHFTALSAILQHFCFWHFTALCITFQNSPFSTWK